MDGYVFTQEPKGELIAKDTESILMHHAMTHTHIMYVYKTFVCEF